MSAADSFFDTNVLLYLLSAEAEKADRAEALLAVGGIVSVQVLNEFASVASRKLAMPIPEIRDILSTIQAVCIVKPLDIETHELGLDMAERCGFSIYDGLIVAAAVRAGCSILYTEDLQQGQVIDHLTIQNPFSSGFVS
jgi:predicted nucleic acid-binding protein